MRSKLLSISLFIICSFEISISQIFWEQTNGPYSGYIHCFAIDSEGVIFSSTLNELIYSTDFGVSWSEINISFHHTGVSNLAINSDGDIFANISWTWDGQGIFRSSDYGDSWTNITSNLSTWPRFNIIAINSTGHIFITTNKDVYRSLDNGDNWTQVNNGLPVDDITTLDISSDNYIFVGMQNNGVFRSIDNGDNWTQVNNSLPDDQITALDISPDDHIFVGTLNNGIFRSIDNGDIWTAVGLANTITGVFAFSTRYSVIAGTSNGIFLSGYGGENWIESNFKKSVYLMSLKVNTRGEILAGTVRHGLYKSVDNGHNWTQIGIHKGFISSLNFDSQGNILAGCRNSDLYRSVDNGNTWIPIGGFQLRHSYSQATNLNGDIFIGSSGVYKSTDNGNSWILVGLDHKTIPTLVIDSRGYIYAGTYEGVFKSENYGEDWESIGLESELDISLAINSRGYIFVGTFRSGIFRSTDDGGRWEQINSGLTDYVINSIAINKMGILFAGSDNGVFRSNDNGETWQIVFSDSEAVVVSSIVISSNNHICIGTDNGFYYSENDGNSWIQANSGLTNTDIRSLAIDVEGYIFAGTNGGVFRSVGSLLSLNHLTDNTVSTLALHHPFPNPFNPSTTIEFSIPQSGIVSLTVYDVLGREVETILNEYRNTGYHKLHWNASDVPSGIYFVRIQSGDFSLVRKAIVVR